MGDGQRLILVRHGVTAWNRVMRMQGHSDTPLDSEGMEQARRVAARLKSESSTIDSVWSSDLQRASKTADAIAERFGLTVETTVELRETMLGDWEGLTRADIEARGQKDLLDLYIKDSLLHRPPGSERLEAMWERMSGAASTIRRAHPTGTVVVVGHGGSLRALICEALGAPITSLRHLWLDNASVSLLEFNDPCDTLGRVRLVNDTSHLR